MNSILEAMGKEFKSKYIITYLTPEEWKEHMKKFKKVEEHG
jgi:hypothetical protein